VAISSGMPLIFIDNVILNDMNEPTVYGVKLRITGDIVRIIYEQDYVNRSFETIIALASYFILAIGLTRMIS
jgi:hypothetical protein